MLSGVRAASEMVEGECSLALRAVLLRRGTSEHARPDLSRTAILSRESLGVDVESTMSNERVRVRVCSPVPSLVLRR